MQTVKEILEGCRSDSDYFTHVSMSIPTGKFSLPRNKIEDFWTAYCRDVMDGISYGLAEKPQNYLPILVDLDLKIKYTEKINLEILYTEKQVGFLVREYRDVIRAVVRDVKPVNLFCFVLVKPAYKKIVNDNEYVSSGLHLHFPYTFLSKSDHEYYIIPKVKKALEDNNIFSSLGVENSADLLDPCYVKNSWLMYGCKKNEAKDPYKLGYVLNEDGIKISLEEALIPGGIPYQIFNTDETVIPLTRDNLEFNLPRILSTSIFYRKACSIKSGINMVNPIQRAAVSQIAFKEEEYKQVDLAETLNVAKKLLTIINPIQSYIDWMYVGWSLYNISRGTEDGFNLWKDFSSRDQEKYNEQKCLVEWSRMENKTMTIGTLHYFAKRDNKDAYSSFTSENTIKYVKSGISGSHYDIGMACYQQYGTEFICGSINADLWFQYKDHRWKKMEAGVYLREKISTDMVKQVEFVLEEMNLKSSESQNDAEKIYCMKEKKSIEKLIHNLKHTTFKNSCFREMKDIFYKETFLTSLNKDPWIIGFKNGVYDLKNNLFRGGIPEDYISKQMPIEYVEYSESHPLVIQVYEFFEKVFPDTQLREYFLDIYSDIFVGGNQRKHVYCWSGCGDNGKSVTQSLFEKMLGPDYAVKLPTSLLVGKRTQSSSASPELVRAGNGVRWGSLQEPSKSDTINTGIFKELSGNDTLYTRDLFQKGEDIKEVELMMKLQLIFNVPPSMPDADKAVWSRVKVISFESIFTDEAPESHEEQIRQKKFPKDPYFAEKIPHLIQPMAWMLLNRRKKERKFLEPEKVKLATDAYRRRNDILKQFADERILDEPTAYLSLHELYSLVCDWHRESIPGKALPEKIDVKEYFIKLWGDTVGTNWKGKRARTYKDEAKHGNIGLIDETELI